MPLELLEVLQEVTVVEILSGGSPGPQGPAGSSGSGDIAIADVDGLQDALAGKAPTTHSHAISDITSLQDALDSKASDSATTAALATKADLVAGKVPSSQLPSFVDDVLEYSNQAGFPGTGETSKIYVALDTGKIYRWSGSAYVEISASPGSTDAVPEGVTNKYYTAARAKTDAVVNSVAGSQTDQAPSVAAVIAALAGKQVSDATLTALAAWLWSSGVEVPTFTALDTLSILRVGTAANNLLQLTAAGKLPAVDASLLTLLDASQLATGIVPLARLLSGSDANPVCAALAADLPYSGTSSQATLQIEIPSAGRWFLFELASFSAGTSQTFTSQLSMGTAAIAGTTNDAVGIGIAGTAVATCVITTGTPTVVSGRASSGTNTAQFVVWMLDVTTPGTIDLKVAPNNGGGSPFCRKGSFFKGIKLG